MPEAAHRVFVSSTSLDLQPERKSVEAVLNRLTETKLVGMEYFGSRDETTRETSLAEVDGSHLYVGIFGGRYGSGITEAEYRRAMQRHIPCLIYFKADGVGELVRETESEAQARLEALKQELRRNHTVTTFSNPDNLAALLTADLHRWIIDACLRPLARGAAKTYSMEGWQDLLGNIRESGIWNPGGALYAMLSGGPEGLA